MSPQAGAMFGFGLLWLVTLTHLFKYHAFEFGPRYAAATGESLIAGYMRLPGPKGWALWIFLLTTIAQGIAVLAGVVGVAAAVLTTFVGVMPLAAWYAVVLVSILLFLHFGGYRWLDFLNKMMMVVLLAATLLVFVPVFPPPRVLMHLVIPSLPAGSLVLAAAILGWMPTGIDVSIWHSLWTLEKYPELSPGSATPADRPRVLRLALADMRIGYALSFVVAAVFLMLAAMFLRDAGGQLKEIGFARALADVYVERMGGWMYVVFMLAAFSAMYSTSYTVMDGFSRSFAETLRTLFPETTARAKARFYWSFVLATAALAFVLLVTVGKPVSLVIMVAMLSLAVAPLYYALNYYCVTRFIAVEGFRPALAARLTAIAGIGIMAFATLFCIASTLLKWK